MLEHSMLFHSQELEIKSLLSGSPLMPGNGNHHVSHDCNHDTLGFVLPAIALVAILGTYMGLLLWRSSDRPAERLFVVGYFLTLADNIVFSLVIPDSYGLVEKLGGAPWLSGLVVGIYKCGTFWGAFLIFLLLHWHPIMWKDFARHSYLVCGMCSVLGTASWLFAALFAGSSQSLQNAPAVLALMLFGRVAGGFGAGIRLVMLRTQIPALNSEQARPRRQAALLFAMQVGMGLGPLIAGSTRMLDNMLCPSLASGRYETVGLVGFAVSLICLFAVVKVLPLTGVQEFDDEQARNIQDDVTDARDARFFPVSVKHTIIVACLGFSMLRAFAVSGGEVTTAMLLEVEFQWKPCCIGIAIGICFLACIPLSMMYTRYGAKLSVKTWIKLMLAVSMLACLLYFPPSDTILAHFDSKNQKLVLSLSLLVADALILSSFWLSDALSQGVMMNHTSKGITSLFNQNNLNMLQVLLLDGLSRTIGPALARGQAELTGRHGYAVQQTVFTMVATCISILIVLPRVQENGAPSSVTTGDEEDLKSKQVAN